MIIEKISETSLMEVDELDGTNRGNGGFGSSGVGILIERDSNLN